LDTRTADAPLKNQGRWKRLSGRVSATILVLLGILHFVAVLYDQFEGHADFWELSFIETLFWGVFLFLSARLYTQAKQAGVSARRMLYLPFRNMGIFLMAGLLIILVASLFLTEAEFDQWLRENAFTQQNLDQAFTLGITLLCIYLASRTLGKELASKSNETDSTESLQRA